MEIKVNVNLYLFRQNNSGGSFVRDGNVGNYVIIQAMNADHANSIALKIGIYFNGVDDEIDCACCGDRWYTVEECHIIESVEAFMSGRSRTFKNRADSVKVHYLNGLIEEFII
jgi:hypothetical protein